MYNFILTTNRQIHVVCLDLRCIFTIYQHRYTDLVTSVYFWWGHQVHAVVIYITAAGDDWVNPLGQTFT